MQTRTLIVIGCITGSVAVLMLVVLITVAFATDLGASPRVSTLLTAAILLGIASGSAFIITANRSDETKYVRGVGDTVDRLASVLPKGNVRRIG